MEKVVAIVHYSSTGIQKNIKQLDVITKTGNMITLCHLWDKAYTTAHEMLLEVLNVLSTNNFYVSTRNHSLDREYDVFFYKLTNEDSIKAISKYSILNSTKKADIRITPEVRYVSVEE